MAPSRKLDPERPSQWVVDYKSAFYGALGLVTIFAGLSWRLFSTDLTDTKAASAITDQDQWVSIRALERQLDGTTREVASCDKFNTALEVRIRELEHRGDRR